MNWEDDRPLPCPHCGASKKIDELGLFEGEGGWYIKCIFCDARGPRSTEIENACMKWNRRVKNG